MAHETWLDHRTPNGGAMTPIPGTRLIRRSRASSPRVREVDSIRAQRLCSLVTVHAIKVPSHPGAHCRNGNEGRTPITSIRNRKASSA